ncbi:saposin b domain-containing protein [Stylonychia lemnae]|uniref:Sphingomyelin phosphodiesterase n=1 Tax=Stylonychia lemnae TaxID=5949 RepID=A0A078ATZ4_STYLE|nr:saposin b domain-containing protein [Stylonychia lemnae]|eukprot:CDW84712.1 saposin b domain-containing protein [Stylonychia lemnae]
MKLLKEILLFIVVSQGFIINKAEAAKNQKLNTIQSYFSDFNETIQNISPDMTQIENVKHKIGDFKQTLECDICLFIAGGVRAIISNQNNQDFITQAVILVCAFKFDVKFCQGMADYTGKELFINLQGKPTEPLYACSKFVNFCQLTQQPDWNEEFLTNIEWNKPKEIESNDYQNKLYQSLNGTDRKVIKILQLTDIHVDLEYAENSSTNCRQIPCCRAQHGFPETKKHRAGKYGAFKCDIPMDLVNLMGEYVNKHIKPDTIVWTGDTVPHNMWEEKDYTEKIKFIELISCFLKDEMSNYTIYPTIGNHDFQVSNLQNLESEDLMMDVLAQLWQPFIQESQQDTFFKTGSYVQKLRVKKGLKKGVQTYENVNIISLNTQACYNLNFYVWNQKETAFKTLDWLEERLQEIEKRSELAILIAHIAPSDITCTRDWSKRYQALVERFQHIIRLQTFGHDHREKHNVVRSIDNQKPIAAQFLTGSFTTWRYNNPSFRVFEMDEETMLPLKIYTYVLKVEDKHPKWYLDHEMTEFYGMKDLSPQSFDDLSNRILEDEKTALKYTRISTQDGPDPETHLEKCDQNCRKELYCNTRSSTYYDSVECHGQKPNLLNRVLDYLSN